MPWSTSNRAAELPSNWPTIRKVVIARENGICQECGAPGDEVDHAVHRDDHRPESLRLLCSDCHQEKTLAEANAARPREKRSPERHPGLR